MRVERKCPATGTAGHSLGQSAGKHDLQNITHSDDACPPGHDGRAHVLARIRSHERATRDMRCPNRVIRTIHHGCDEIDAEVDCDRHTCPVCWITGRHGLINGLKHFYNVVAEHNITELHLTSLAGKDDREKYSDRHRKAVAAGHATGSLVIPVVTSIAIGISDYRSRKADQTLTIPEAVATIDAAFRQRHERRRDGHDCTRLAWAQEWRFPDLPVEETPLRANPEKGGATVCTIDRRNITQNERTRFAQAHGAIPHPRYTGWRFPTPDDLAAYLYNLADLSAQRSIAIRATRSEAEGRQRRRHLRPLITLVLREGR